MRLFRLTPAGGRAYQRIASGADVEPSRLVERLVEAGAIHPVPAPGTSPFQAVDVTVVVPALRAEAAALAKTVAACAGVAAIVIVDDASEPPLAAVEGAVVLRLRTNVGPSVARNAGIGATRTELVAFVDTDVDLPGGWLQPLLDHFADGRVALVAPRVATRGGGGLLAAYEARHSPLDLGSIPALVAPGRRISYVPAAVLIARVDALHHVGMFERELRVGEDVDLVWRLHEAGWRCRYEPTVVVHHRPRPTWRQLLTQRIAYGSSAGPLAARHPGALAPIRLSIWSAAVWTLVLAERPAAAVAVAAATSVALVRKLRGVPPALSLRLAATGHVRAGRQLAEAARRAWWPLLAVAAVGSRRARRFALLGAAPALIDGGPARLLDDLAYGAGVWKGVLAERDIAALLPSLQAWPERQRRSLYPRHP